MKYFSTRGGSDRLSFEDTVLTGLAPNGGLYIPEHIPSLPSDWQEKWKSLPFVDLAVEVLSLYISEDEISREDLRKLLEKSYSTFRHPEITPLQKLDDKLFVLELFHGPTFAFKDVALQFLGNLFEYFLVRRNAKRSSGEQKENLTVVGATSGDTGSAAIYGLRNKENISIFILHPKGRISPIQQAQMTTITDANVHNIAVKGSFDDCQDIVKVLFGDKEFNKKHRLGAVNSINWARILAQTVYYFLSYLHIQATSPGAQIQYVVPTGNFGDVLAGYYAKRMGLPMDKLVIATNSNDILARFWKSGRYERVEPEAEAVTTPPNGTPDGNQPAVGAQETLSPAMDILVSSNFERLLWYLAYEGEEGGSVDTACAVVDGWMKTVKSNGRVEVPQKALELARRDFTAERVSDDQTLTTIRKFYEAEPSYVADPHTAVGLTAAQTIASGPTLNSPIQVSLSTAHPAKFSEAVATALKSSPTFSFDRDVLPEEFRGLLQKQQRVIEVESVDVNLVKNVIESKVDTKQTGTSTVY